MLGIKDNEIKNQSSNGLNHVYLKMVVKMACACVSLSVKVHNEVAVRLATDDLTCA